MGMSIVKREENPLLSREELIIRVEKEVTPSRKEAKEIVVAQTGADPELVIIKRISGKSGSKVFLVEAFIYKDKEIMKVIEPEYVLRRNGVVSDGEAQAQ